MFSPQHLEMMVDDIQADYRKAAEMDALTRTGKSNGLNLRETVGNFIIAIRLKVKGQLQVKSSLQQPEAM
jgi:hypothetical protein